MWINIMANSSNDTSLIIALVIVLVLFVILAGGMMTGAMMSGGMMGHGVIGGFSMMWVPTLLTLAIGVVLGWLLFGKR